MPRALEGEIRLDSITCGLYNLILERVTLPLYVDPSVVSTSTANTGGARQSRYESEVTPSSNPALRTPSGVVKTKIGALITGQIYHRKYRKRVCVCVRARAKGINETRR